MSTRTSPVITKREPPAGLSRSPPALAFDERRPPAAPGHAVQVCVAVPTASITAHDEELSEPLPEKGPLPPKLKRPLDSDSVADADSAARSWTSSRPEYATVVATTPPPTVRLDARAS